MLIVLLKMVTGWSRNGAKDSRGHPGEVKRTSWLKKSFQDVRSAKNEVEAPPKTLQTYKPADSSKILDALNSGFRRKITFRSRWLSII